MSNEGLENIKISNNKRRIKEIKKCKNCEKEFYKNLLYCSDLCRREDHRKTMDEYKKYKADCQFSFNLKDYPEEFDFSLIEKYGWYSPTNGKNNLNGVSRDHLLSIKDGFELKINPKIISHPANCRLIIHRENASKNRKSIINLEELLEKIIKFENK